MNDRATPKRSQTWLLGGLCALALVSPPGAEAGFKISSPSLEPGFRQKAHDYVLDCRRRVKLRVRSDRRGLAKIAGGRFFNGRRAQRVRMRQGQAVRVVRKHGQHRKRKAWYHLRCLPRDFPDYSFRRFHEVRTAPFMVAPITSDFSPNYAIVFDEFGAPIWWLKRDRLVIDAKVIRGRRIALGYVYELGHAVDPRSRYMLFSPAGRKLKTVQTVGSPTDLHDLQQTRNGDMVLVSYKERGAPVDASEFNGDSSARVLDAVIQRQGPNGKLLWQWNSKDHIGLEETGRWWPSLGEEPYDIVHLNSVEPIPGGDYLVSTRHTDAVYRIDGKTGEVEWKLGGEPTPKSLNVLDDPLGDDPLGGQHDARMLNNGTVTIHDNGTGLGRPPRGVRYRIAGRQARMVESIDDEQAPSSGCCGSARRLGHSWLFGWGGRKLTTEIDGRGRRAFELHLPNFTYRATPIDGAIGKPALRRGMNRQVPLKR